MKTNKGSLSSLAPTVAARRGNETQPRRVGKAAVAGNDTAAPFTRSSAGDVITDFFGSATLAKDGSIKWLKRRGKPRRANVDHFASGPQGRGANADSASAGAVGGAAAGAQGVALEIDHTALAASVGETRRDNSISFRVEAVSGGSLLKWNGSNWEAIVAGTTAVVRGEKLQWVPVVDGTALIAFKVQGLVDAQALPPVPTAPENLFVITLCRAEGQIENVVARGQDAVQHLHLATALRESREELRRLSGMLVSIQEDERRRIALDLHDGLGQSLSLIKLAMEQSARLLAEGQVREAGEAMNQLTRRVGEALADVRRVSTDLRPLILDDLGVLPTLSWFFREFRAVSDAIVVETAFNVTEQDIPACLHITIFRIIQEAFHNIVKHAAANRVRVRLERVDARLHLLIEDNGCGFDPGSVKCVDCLTRGQGLLSMRERASFTGGAYHLKSALGQGTCIWVSWPCPVPN